MPTNAKKICAHMGRKFFMLASTNLLDNVKQNTACVYIYRIE